MSPAIKIGKLGRAQKLASGAHVAAVVAAVLFVAAMIAEHGLPAANALAQDGLVLERLNAALLLLIPVLPLVLLLTAVLRLRMALDHYSDGAFFEAKPARHIAKSGEDVAMALVATAVIVPTLLAWTGDRHGGLHFNIEPYMVGMFAFALFVMVVGRILEAAAEIKAENDQII